MSLRANALVQVRRMKRPAGGVGLFILLLVAAFGGVGTAAGQSGKAPMELRFGIKDNLVELAIGPNPTKTYLHIAAKSSSDTALPDGAINVEDRPLPNAKGQIEFRTIGPASSDAKLPVWVVEVTATDWPENSLQERVAVVKLGSLQQLHRFQVTSQPAAALDVTVEGPGGLWKLGQNGPVSIDVRAGAQSFAGVSLVRSILVNGNGDRISVGQLRLCADPECKTVQTGAWAADKGRSIFLGLMPEVGSVNPGRYTGNVTFGFDGRRDRKDVALELAHSPDGVRRFGMGLVALGILLAFFATVVRPLKVQRLSAERAAIAIAARLADMQASVAEAARVSRVPLTKLDARLEAWAQSLGLDKLERMLPPKALWDAAKKFDAALLATQLSAHEAKLASLAILIVEGLRPLSQMAAGGTRPDVENAIHVLDGFDEGMSPDTTRALVKSGWDLVVSTRLERAIRPMQSLATVAIDRIELQLSAWSAGYWVLMLVLSWVGACALLIWNNPGFGLWQDLLWCLFWGFGLPTSLDKLKDLSPGSFAMPVSIALPKV